MMTFSRPWTRAALLIALLASITSNARAADTPVARPLLLAHYMAWFGAPPHSPQYGWHWTMNAFDPSEIIGDKRRIASHYYPSIGPYDSGDAAIVEAQLQAMKEAGIDGVIVDWYGRTDYYDYASIHRNCELVLQTAARLQMKFAVCYEDQTVPILVAGGQLKAENRAAHASEELRWLEANWFANPAYLRWNGKPVWLSFGNGGLTDTEWETVLAARGAPSIYLSEHRQRAGAQGAFDWPIPGQGLKAVEDFVARSRDWPVFMPVIFPRFHDIYGAAKVQDAYPIIPDDAGHTFERTLQMALHSGAPFAQIATWNDWGEGTQIEPSREFGRRDLEALARLRNSVD